MDVYDEKYQKIQSMLARNQPLFRALGDLARQEIIMVLACHDRLSVGELAGYTQLSRPAISHHLRILKEAGLLKETKAGVKRFYTPTFREAVESMNELIETTNEAKEML